MTYFKPLVGMIWRCIESYGIDPRLVIDENIYQPGKVNGLGERVPFSVIEKLVMEIMKVIDDPALGIRFGEHLLPSHLGSLGYAWMASSTLNAGVQRLQRFGRMYSEQEELLSSERQGVFIVEQRLRHVSPIKEVVVDAQQSALLTLCRTSFDKSLKPLFVKMNRPQPADPTAWHQCFGVEVKFNQAKSCMGFKLEDVNKQLTGANRQLVLMHEDVIRRQLSELDRSEILGRTVKTILEQLPSGGVNESSVARQLNMTKRTLYRKLAEKDVSFRTLLTNIRKDLVSQYIDEPTYSMTEISFLLGYADTSAFSRAFKRWYGVSPTQAREEM